MSAGPLAVAVHGASGRMGRTILQILADDRAAHLVAAIDRPGHPALGQDVANLIGRSEPLDVKLSSLEHTPLKAVQVVIDFTSPDATRAVLERCARDRVAAVVGTTGMDPDCERALAALAQVAPVVAAPNFSIGVSLLMDLAERAARLAGPDFDLEIVEMHHKHKADSPSGTAVRLAEVVARTRDLDPARAAVHGRSGPVGARRSDEIGVLALRGGDVVGDHTLILAGAGERLELTHRAQGRHIFARGAVRAAHWVVGKPAGRYDMADVLGT